VAYRGGATKKISSVVATAVPCRFGAGPRMTRIHANRKNKIGAARRGDPSFRRECAVLPPTQILPQRRRDAEEGILGILRILPRRAEIRVSQELTRRHEATKKIRCSNGSPLPFWSRPANDANPCESKKQGRVVSPQTTQASGANAPSPPNPNPPAEPPSREKL
jgi:hypothetical protein